MYVSLSSPSAIAYEYTLQWTNAITSRCDSDCAVDVQFKIAKWVFVGCIIFSFLLLGYETYKAKKVIDSRDISYAFTNLLANDYYSFRKSSLLKTDNVKSCQADQNSRII